jgi:hypothetical protein
MPSNPARRQGTVDQFIKNYDIPERVSDPERAADFLHELSEQFPGDFVSKRNLVKIASNLPSVPNENSDKLKKLPYIIGRADRILERKHRKRIVSDRVEGYRATSDDMDLEQTRYRRDLQRVASAQRAALKTAELINPRNLTGPIREEFMKSTGAIRRIGEHMEGLPLLPPKKVDHS